MSALSWEAHLARGAPVVVATLRLWPTGPRQWGAAFSAVVLAEVLAELVFAAVVVPAPLGVPCNDYEGAECNAGTVFMFWER